MNIGRQPSGQRTQESGCALIGQQVKIVNKNIAGLLTGQRMTQIVDQQSAARSVGRTVVFPQEGKACTRKGVLHTFPENRKIARVHTDAHNVRRFGSGTFREIPLHRRRFAVSHGCNHGRHGTARDWPQALLQSLGYVDRVQIPFRFWHNAYLRCASTDFFVYNGFSLYVIIPILSASVN